MTSMYPSSYTPAFRDDMEMVWSASSSSSASTASQSLQQPSWTGGEIMLSPANAFQFPIQQVYSHIEPQQFLQSFANAFNPAANNILPPDNSPFLPALYPVKIEQVVATQTIITPHNTASRHMQFPTPGPSPHVSPSPEIKPVPDQSGSINALMKEIQSRSVESPVSSPGSIEDYHEGTNTPPSSTNKASSAATKAKKHFCPHDDCGKTFSQKTHLDIHLRSHSGLKPFACPYPPCPSRFTQLGNLKTHIRRHTGEKPFSCDLCSKRFAQRGNVRSHRATVHASREEKRMFECRLDGCGKFFSQRGNLKGHMERFHQDAISELTLKFSNIQDGQDMDHKLTKEERELWEYLREMYKHSNKGIKGRGKDRKVMTITPSQYQSFAALPTLSLNHSSGIADRPFRQPAVSRSMSRT